MIYSFPPISASNARILILGSMPGAESLRQEQYYAHPRNLFWAFMQEIFGGSIESYPERLALAQASGLAIWDVLKACKREGSLDSQIDKSSELANDFAHFLSQHRNIKKICFNGQKAASTYRTRVLEALPDQYAGIEYVSLPSTSPANAAIPRDLKFQAWRDALLRGGSE